jgi:hypothetical protein
MEVRTVLWTAEAAVCESILRVEAAFGVTWTLLKGGKGPFLGAIRISQRMQRMLCSFIRANDCTRTKEGYKNPALCF